MRRGARDSQVINNFFTFGTIIIISVVITLYSKYFSEPSLKDQSSQKKLIILPCSKDCYFYAKIFDKTLLSESLSLLNKGSYVLDGAFLEAIYSKSYIKEYLSIEQQDKFFIESIKVAPKKNPVKYLTIKYELIENDKNDKNKKNKECKLHAGSLQTSFRLNGKEVFRVFTDFKYFDKIEIANLTDCTIRTFISNAN